MRRLAFMHDSLDGAYVCRVFGPDGWQGVCAGTYQDCRTKAGAWLWCLRTAWRTSRDDERLARFLGEGFGRG